MQICENLKFYIFEDDTCEEPLTWDDKAIQFDTLKEAEFFQSCLLLENTGFINECILYYDYGSINFKDIPKAELEEEDNFDFEDFLERGYN